MAGRGSSQRTVTLLLLVPFFLWLFAFLLLPAIMMLISSFRNEGGQGFTLGQYAKGLTHPLYTTAIRNSVLLSLFSAFVGIVLSVFAAYSFTTFSAKARDRMLSISNMMSNFSGVPLAFGFMVLFGTNGLLTVLFKRLGLPFLAFDLYTWKGLALVYAYFQIPVGILMIYPSLYAIRQEWKEAASLLGASAAQFWQRIGVPVLLPGIVGTFSVLFANAMGAYATAYALVTSNYNLLPIQIGSMVSGEVFPRMEMASSLAVILFVILTIALWINERMLRLARKGL
ncbi:ABC transporter permease [Cohnella caldifontis]|uniref:ABC transporter permease n=1 Tax=Cohnella caldifontis TaxID=3027471 RepID=UPI0023ECF983|nr:ABC transporter permease subunit [Cohnella sp. YIM B05605]